MKTIAYYGDSFCASDRNDSWCVLLADWLGCNIMRLGIGGSSIWSTFLEFEQDQKTGSLADYIIFCWTDSHRLYHPTLPLTPQNQPIAGTDPAVWKAADDYYKYLSFQHKDNIAYSYALQWFDKKILHNIKENNTIVQMWSMLPFKIKLESGIFLEESCLVHSWDGDLNFKNDVDLDLSNHMTVQQNESWAKKIYDRIKEGKND